MSKRLILAVLLGSSLVTAGCGHKATGQTVAVVNGEEVSIGELNAELAGANLPPNADKKQAMSQLLQNIINRRVLAQKAVEQGLDKSPEFLNRLRRAREELLIGMSSERQSDSAKLPDQSAIDSFIASNGQMFAQRSTLTLDQIQFDMPANASVLGKLKDDHSMEQVAASLTAMGIPFVRAKPKVDTASLPPELIKRIDALPPTEPFVLPLGGKVFANVIVAREPISTPPENERKIALQMMRRQSAAEALDKEAKQLRSTAKIEYQPGYQPVANPSTAHP